MEGGRGVVWGWAGARGGEQRGLVLGAVLAARPPSFPWGSHPRLGGWRGQRGDPHFTIPHPPILLRHRGGIYGRSTPITPLAGMLCCTFPYKHGGVFPRSPRRGLELSGAWGCHPQGLRRVNLVGGKGRAKQECAIRSPCPGGRAGEGGTPHAHPPRVQARSCTLVCPGHTWRGGRAKAALGAPALLGRLVSHLGAPRGIWGYLGAFGAAWRYSRALGDPPVPWSTWPLAFGSFPSPKMARLG